MGAADALRRAIGGILEPGRREEFEGASTEVRRALGEEAFATAWERGSAMTLETAAAAALESSNL